MKTKSFVARDMRTALKMIRDEYGDDAVIMSSHETARGIEVISTVGYDQLAAKPALRVVSSSPAGQPLVSIEAAGELSCDAAINARYSAIAGAAPRAPIHDPASDFANALLQGSASLATEPARPESFLSRMRARFRSLDSSEQAELSAAIRPAAAAEAVRALPLPSTSTEAANTGHVEMIEDAPAGDPALSTHDTIALALRAGACNDSSAAAIASGHGNNTTTARPGTPAAPTGTTPASPALSLVPSQAEATNPAIVAMRDELAHMRRMMESQMQQLERERLRGSPVRAAALDALAGQGCDLALAQAVVAGLDPTLTLDAFQAPLLDALAAALTVTASEPIDDDGVIALVGPTGAGKTITAAKLAARYAARHRARDVALITTNGKRPGAHEQMQAHGRRLGITVCEARGASGLQHALAQLSDYPLVLVDTTGCAMDDRALFNQMLWLRASRKVRSLLVLPANGNPQDMDEVVRRYRLCSPEALVLTKLDETGYLGAALSVAVRNALPIAYTTDGQRTETDIDAGDRMRIALAAVNGRRRNAIDNITTTISTNTDPLSSEPRHVVA